MKYLPIRLIGDGGYLIVEISLPFECYELILSFGSAIGHSFGGVVQALMHLEKLIMFC